MQKKICAHSTFTSCQRWYRKFLCLHFIVTRLHHNRRRYKTGATLWNSNQFSNLWVKMKVTILLLAFIVVANAYPQSGNLEFEILFYFNWNWSFKLILYLKFQDSAIGLDQLDGNEEKLCGLLKFAITKCETG